MSNLVGEALQRQLQVGYHIEFHICMLDDGTIRLSSKSFDGDVEVQTIVDVPAFSQILDAIGIQVLELDRQINTLVLKECE